MTARTNIRSSSRSRPLEDSDKHIRLKSNGQPPNIAALSTLHQHLLFFDQDGDGIIWPQDTYKGLRQLGYGFLQSAIAPLLIHTGLSYSTLEGWIPDPFVRIYLQRIYRAKHGSDTGVYDRDGMFVPEQFEALFLQYSKTKPDALTLNELFQLMHRNRMPFDLFGWVGAGLEWLGFWALMRPPDGLLHKEDVRAMYDGTLFFKVASERQAKGLSK